MILVDVMDAIGAALDTITDLRVRPYTEQRVTPPAAMVTLPTRIDYDETMGRGSDQYLLPVIVFVGRVDAGSSHRALGAYVDGTGSKSVKKAIETHDPQGAYDFAHVQDVQFVVMAVAGIELLTATFRVRIVGKG
jgi:hypothetical protein